MPSWSRDGKWIYYNSDRDGTVHIWKRPAAGGMSTPVTRRRSYQAVESVDAKTVYFLPALEEPGIYRIPAAGGEESILPGTERLFVRRHWQVTADGIFFTGDEQAPLSVFFYRFATGTIELVRRLAKPLIADTESLAVDPQRTLLLFCQQDEERSKIMIARKPAALP